MAGLNAFFGRKNNTNPFTDFNGKNITAGCVSGLLAIISVPVIILQAAENGGFTNAQTISWMLTMYIFGGLFSVLIPLYYRIPIVGASSITGVAFLATVTSQFSYHQLVGAYVLTGLLMLIVGYFGFFKKLIDYVPKEIIAAMLAGMIMKYMTNFIVSISQMALIGILSLLVFFVFSYKKMKVPPLIAAVATAFILLLVTYPLQVSGGASAFVLPTVQMPVFSVLGFLSVAIPLALLILSNDAAVGIGAVEQNDYRPPVNQLVSLGGVFTIFAGFFGGISANVAGMMSAICSDEEAGPFEKRYIGAVISGLILIAFGLLSWKLVPFIQALPANFVAILVGLSLLGVFANSLHTSFSKPQLKMSAAFAFIIAASGITLFNISAPVWSLLVGTFIARKIETKREKAELNKRTA
ncbi:benzoate/H(+) symporter BenE family transporter [Alkalihalobacillus oceani]|uniref:benzoate/H(+) symporter BenE family transporter n=1 Tax=Halalkalibacter oceani TaxID=1653776 RepID=UPI00203AA69E|nr:benzoate/H(+) symporter BenE family transporter [Halalkalibacter oceani]MCM3759922.1 benzoate/H(+) symporter BenE family transporter [Halalkalibacter oceani]